MSRLGEVFELRADTRKPNEDRDYTSLLINVTDGTWIGGIGICGEPMGGHKAEAVKFTKEKYGNYTLFAANCGKWSTSTQGSALVVLDEKSGQVVYLKNSLKLAKFSLPNGIHSGPLKNKAEVFTCQSPEFDPSAIELLKKFDDLASILKARGSDAMSIHEAYEKVHEAEASAQSSSSREAPAGSAQ
ncbi:MAG: hypothetical protein NDJ90_08415 [Oligoflexia bacterium]|nr:hypothetical protein [Oligoflexia bacterium]